MAPTTRSYDVQKRESGEELVASLKQDPSRNLAYPPSSFVTRREAFRKWGLNYKDLEALSAVAYVTKNQGQEGVYYPEAEIRALKQHIEDSAEVQPDMIPEVMIRRQVPKKKLKLEELRHMGVRGRKAGHKGRTTLYYKKKDVERCLDLKVITDKMQEGVDYILFKKVPAMLTLQLPSPSLGIKTYGQVYNQAQLYYFRPDVDLLRMSPLMVNV